MKGGMIRSLALVCALAAAAACSSARGDGVRPSSSPLLTQEEMASMPGTNMYEVIERLRPRWLQTRGPMSLSGGIDSQIVVFHGNSYMGGPDQLRQFHPRDVVEVRYMDGPTASARLRGYPTSMHVVGAIVLVTTERS